MSPPFWYHLVLRGMRFRSRGTHVAERYPQFKIQSKREVKGGGSHSERGFRAWRVVECRSMFKGVGRTASTQGRSLRYRLALFRRKDNVW